MYPYTARATRGRKEGGEGRRGKRRGAGEDGEDKEEEDKGRWEGGRKVGQGKCSLMWPSPNSGSPALLPTL